LKVAEYSSFEKFENGIRAFSEKESAETEKARHLRSGRKRHGLGGGRFQVSRSMKRRCKAGF